MASRGAQALSTAPNSILPVTFNQENVGYLGVDFEDLTNAERVALHLQDMSGVAIAAVDQDAPAGQAGLKAQDIVVRMNDHPTQTAVQAREIIGKMFPGQKLSLTFLRNGRTLEKTVQLANRKDVEQRAWSQHYTVPAPAQHSTAGDGSLPASPSADSSQQVNTPASTQESGLWSATSSEFGKIFGTNGMVMSWIPWTNAAYTGVELDTMEPQLARYFHILPGAGLLVKSVDNNSPGARAGLHAGDIVLTVDGAPMTSRSKWQRVVRANRNYLLLLQIQRNRQPMTLTMTVHDTK